MTDSKHKIRRGTLINRRLLAADVWYGRSAKVCEQARSFLEAHQVDCFHVFLPIRRNKEVDTWPLVEGARDREVILSATDFERETMRHFRYTAATRIVEDKLGIPTPQNAGAAQLSALELIFIPMLAGDKRGHRIGYGKGYYDRLLAEVPKTVLKVGLTLNPLFDRFPFAEPHDVAMDYCITPWEVVECSATTRRK